MTALIRAYKKYKEGGGGLTAFESYANLVFPSQVAGTIDYYEAKLDRFSQSVIAAKAGGNLRFNLAMAYLGGQELFGSDWDYISEADVKLLDELRQRLAQNENN